ncbi:acyl CoA:acetate/3-ketoacid CoA transferase [Mycoplasma sp. P36-A1]|uniref:acyl CoA:acetate/3-ketoacid CoA transferase n=1 Tax=Mycoplasma sp. P36-A1 TaxID=3252900 RepID=UPI003C2EFC17
MEIIASSKIASLIKNEATVMVSGFIGSGVPEELLLEIEKNYLEKQSPKDLELIFCAGVGDGKDKGLNHLAHEGLVKRTIGGHYGLSPKITKLVFENKIAAYNFPQGIMARLIRTSAAKVPFIVSKVGLNTFVDPRIEGGKLNKECKDDLVKLFIDDDGSELLKYSSFNADVALIRGTYADKKGNISFAKEPLITDSLSMAQAAKNNGGIVIVQVEAVVDETFDPKTVVVPGILVDYVVVATNPEYQMQTFHTDYNEEFVKNSGKEIKLPTVKLSDRKIIARRAAMELSKSDAVLNYGIGIPEMVANVLNEEGVEEHFTPTVEPGIIGGVPQGGLDFGASMCPEMILTQNYQFDFYDGNGIDCTFLGLAQTDQYGNLNVSKFGPKIAGAGGFINISQNAKKVIFCGTFKAGAKLTVENNELKINEIGHTKKFIENVEQITFSSQYAIDNNLEVLYVTERAVFDLDRENKKLRLIEIAPGMDLEKDVLQEMDFRPVVSENLKIMDSSIFNEDKMNLKLK